MAQQRSTWNYRTNSRAKIVIKTCSMLRQAARCAKIKSIKWSNLTDWMWYRTREIVVVPRTSEAKSVRDAGVSNSRVVRRALDHSKTLPQTKSTTGDSSTIRSTPKKSETKANFSLTLRPAGSTLWITRTGTRRVQSFSRTKLPHLSTLKRDVQTLAATRLHLRPASPAQTPSGK